MGLRGIIENLNDGRVKIVADGEEEKLRLFESVIDIKNSLKQVSSIEMVYSESGGEFSNFGKLAGLGETDSRLDEGVGVLKDMRELLVSILGKQDETISEIKDTNRSLNDKGDIAELKGDVAEIKTALRAKGII